VYEFNVAALNKNKYLGYIALMGKLRINDLISCAIIQSGPMILEWI